MVALKKILRLKDGTRSQNRNCQDKSEPKENVLWEISSITKQLILAIMGHLLAQSLGEPF